MDDFLLQPKTKSKTGRYVVRGLIFLFVLALLGGTGFTLFMKIKYADFQPPMSPANVVVSPVTAHEFKDTIEAIGTITASESATLTATITETIKAINATEGQFVAKGASIIDLTDTEEQANLSQASKSFDRYNQLVRNNLASPETRDQQQAGLDVAKAQLDKRKIVAPFDGFLGVRHVNVGDLVQPGTVITTIDAIDPIKLDFTVPEVYLSALKQDMEIEATTDAWPDVVFKGKIYVIDSRIDRDTRAIMARAIMANADHKLKPGLLMKVKIIREVKQSLAISETAVQSAGQKKTVFVVGADKKVTAKDIQTGQREPGMVEVVSGLVAGDKVIVEGQMKTGAGAEVNVVAEKTLLELLQEDASFSIPRKQEALKKDFQIEPAPTKQEAKPDSTDSVKTDGQAK